MLESELSETWTRMDIGASRLLIRPPRTCVVTYVGDLDVAVVQQMHAALKDASRVCGRFLWLVDLSRTGQISHLGRRDVSNGLCALDPIAVAVFGASFNLRVVVGMIVKAARLLNQNFVSPVEFFHDEASAQSWLNELQGKSSLQLEECNMFQ